MITILSAAAYLGYSAPLEGYRAGAKNGAQPIYIGRVVWPGRSVAEDVVIKLYDAKTCGTANEAIGYVANAIRGVSQPKRAAILLLSKKQLPVLGVNLDPFIDVQSGLAPCWVTSFEQDAAPFRFVRRLSSFTDKQSLTFYKSHFCHLLASVDHVTGNSDRNEGNFLYIDDLNYVAIDQGCVGGSMSWHTIWPDNEAKNELVLLADRYLNASQLAYWHSKTLLEHAAGQPAWPAVMKHAWSILTNLLNPAQIDIITDYMERRANGNRLAESCGKLL
jgi:hypothetical protein